jgi:hypothetical protein
VGHFPTDGGLARYANTGAFASHGTAVWSHNYMSTTAVSVRTNFAHYNCFTPGWYGRYPGAWAAAGWAAGTAWSAATWPAFATWCSIPSTPVYYDYGTNVVYQGDTVIINGAAPEPADQYAQGVATIADQGRQADPPTDTKWQAFGVFALVEGTEKTSNNVFQLAVDQAGIIRGNYYDGLMDTTTPVYGAVDKKTQRAAWSIGDKKDTVFETGAYNLTKDQTAVLVHFGKDKTQQWMLVRVQQPKGQPKQAQ